MEEVVLGLGAMSGTQGDSLLVLPPAFPAPDLGSTLLPAGHQMFRAEDGGAAGDRSAAPPGPQVSQPFVRFM